MAKKLIHCRNCANLEIYQGMGFTSKNEYICSITKRPKKLKGYCDEAVLGPAKYVGDGVEASIAGQETVYGYHRHY